jgi:hypothetical protein
MEVETGLKRDIRVTPVLVQGAHMPVADQLPVEIGNLAYRNGFELAHNRWDSDVREMMRRLGLPERRPRERRAREAEQEREAEEGKDTMLERLVTILPKLRNKVQATGLAVIVAAVIATRSLAPTDIPAQLAAGSVGILVLIFGQTFSFLNLIPARNRAAYILSMFFGFLLFAASMTVVTIYLVLDKPDSLGGADPEYNRLLEATVGRPETKCAAEAGGSVVQLFKSGWMLARFSEHALFAIKRGEDGTLYWKKHIDNSESRTVACDGIENEALLEWGIRA